jgi:hypothetical protein
VAIEGRHKKKNLTYEKNPKFVFGGRYLNWWYCCGTEWWNEEVRVAVEEKKEAYLKWVAAKKESEKKSTYEVYKKK